MPLPLWVALLSCGALVAVDLVARALRIHLFVRATGHRMRFWDVFVLNVFGDAASAATPMRLGGEPARLVGLLQGGVPISLGVPLLALEVLSYTGVVALVALAASWRMGGGWWAGVGPQLSSGLRAWAPWIAGVVILSLLAVVLGRRMRREAGPRERTPWQPLKGALGWPLAVSVPLTMISVASRVAILPVLAFTLPAPPPVDVLVFSSFAFIYGQIFLPTPAGLGAVEVAFASGAAGSLGGEMGTVFLFWRGFTTLVPLVLGFGLAIPHYGAPAVRAALRGRGPRPEPAGSDPLA